VLPLTSPAAAAPAPSALDPAELLTSWLSTAGADDLQPRMLRLADGRLVPLPVARWAGPVDRADETMLAAAPGPVLDLGCGPGRLTAALHTRGVDVLGVEILPTVPVLARAAGAPLLLGDVFGPLPRKGQWRTVLLADGNIGIGGDPVRLEGLGAASSWFPWAVVGPIGGATAAAAASLRVEDSWTDWGRAFVVLVPA
jgi:SAM-dependent methyltransferase